MDPLYYAVREKKLAVMKALLNTGAKVGVRDRHGQTPLYLAVVNSESSVTLTTLLKAGADPNARNNRGQTPLHYAAECEIPKNSI